MHEHDLELLIADRGFRVQYCHACEIVHVDVGPITLRLRSGALDILAEVLARSGMELRARLDDLTDTPIAGIRDSLPN